MGRFSKVRKSWTSLGSRVPQELKPQLRFYTGLIVGGVLGVVFTILVFSAFLFQVLEAISTAVLAFATVVLALSTLSLYRVTRFQAGIEVKRDRRSNLEERIPLGEKLSRTEPNQIMIILRGQTTQYSEMEELESSVRRLRQIITYGEAETDDEVFQILPLLDLLIRKFDVNANIGGKAIENKDDEESVTKWIVGIQGLPKILVPRWRSQIQFLYE